MKKIKTQTAFLIFMVLGYAQAGERLTLSTAIREALGKSEEALMLNEKGAKSEAQKAEAWSSALPHVNGFANAGRGRTVMDPSTFTGAFPLPPDVKIPATFDITQTRYAYGVEANQAIFSFGRLGLAIKAAGIMDKSDNAARKRSRQQLQLQALDLFFGAVTARARLSTLEASIKRQGELVGFMQNNFRMGAGMRSSVLLATAGLKFLEPQRIRADRDAEAAEMALNRLLGRPLHAPLDLDTASARLELAALGASDSAALASIVDDRPDINALAHQRKFLEAEARFFKMQYLPAIGAQGKIGVTAYKPDQLGDFGSNSEWQVGVGLTWNLFDGFGSLAKAHQFDADARSVGYLEQEMRKMAQIEIESALKDFWAADTALAASEQALAAGREAQALLSDDFRAGKGQLVDLLTAEQSLREAEFGLLAARYNHVRSRAALQIALGKNLINEEEKP